MFISQVMVGRPGEDRVQLQSDGRVTGKLWQWGPFPDSFLGSPGDAVVDGTGVVGAEWMKDCTPCWRKRMTPMLVPVPTGSWLKDMVPGELRGGLQIGVVWIQVRFIAGHSVRCQGCFGFKTKCPSCVWPIFSRGGAEEEVVSSLWWLGKCLGKEERRKKTVKKVFKLIPTLLSKTFLSLGTWFAAQTYLVLCNR